MDFNDSGIDSDPKLDNYNFDKSEPIISFSPDRCRYDLPGSNSGTTNDTASILSFANTTTIDSSSMVGSGTNPTSISTSSGGGGTTRSLSQTNSIGNTPTSTDLHRRLEKRIARANSTSINSSWTGKGGGGETQNGKENRNDHGTGTTTINSKVNHNTQIMSRPQNTTEVSHSLPPSTSTTTTTSLVNLNALQQIPNCSSSSASVQPSSQKVPTLLPPQRLAIPNKSHHSNLSNSNEGSSSENKPLVQWESDESEEELSFFPAPRSRGILNDNLSIDNMSLSGEEDDLHLSPPRPLSQRCPCDPRLLFDSSITSVSSVSSPTATSSSSSPKHCCIS